MQFHSGCLQEGNLYIVPVCHYRMEFAEAVRHAFLSVKPDLVAVELPSTLQDYLITAVGRFPHLSVICYQTGQEELVYFPVEPADPFYEGIRSAMENSVPVHAIDLDMDDYPLLFDPMPDSYALYRLGLERYWKEYCKAREHAPIRTREDDMREAFMAYNLRKLMTEEKRVLFICGMAHVHGVMEKLGLPSLVQPLGKVVRKEIVIYDLHADSIREVTGEMPFLISVYEMERGKHDTEDAEKARVIAFPARPEAPVELSTPPVKRFVTSYREQKEKSILSQILKILGKKLSSLPDMPALKDSDSLSREVAGFTAMGSGRKLDLKNENVFRFKTSEDRRGEILNLYRSQEKRAPSHSDGRTLWDRQRLTLKMVRQAAAYYRENTGDEILHWQHRTMLKFARNYAFMTGMLIADFYQLIMAARGVADDNFAYEIWDLGSFYPWLDRSGSFPTIHIKADEVWLGGRKFTLRRRFPRLREKLTRLPVKERRKEREPGEWNREFDDMYMCSYPPEDIIIEGYGDYLKKKAINILSEERARVEPFSNSLLDGIDIRETIRNWHHQKKLYVRENQKIGGGAGSVVVIFDEDQNDARYPWKMTWLGEHSQESDMAFYATPMEAKIVGPGIARCEYGGFMLTSPPLRLFDVWSDPFYAQARSKSEVLLMAAIEYSTERHVVYVASRPPRSWFRTFAGRLNRKLVYIPVGQLSPASLKKLRVFHVLSGRSIREYAKEYVW